MPSDDEENYFQNLFGVLHWSVELGWIDIHVQVAMLSSYLAQLHQGHLDAVFQICVHSQKYKWSKLVFDEMCMNWGSKSQAVDWTDFYPDSSEPIPPMVQEPLGKGMQPIYSLDAGHTGTQITQ